MLTAQSINLRKPLFERLYFLIPAIILTALVATFALELTGFLLAGILFAYFWKHKDRLVLFLIIYTPFEEVVLKILPDSLYGPARYFWEGMLFAMLGLMILDKCILSRQWKKSVIDVLVLVFIIAWFLSGFINNIPIFFSLASIKNLIRYIAIFYIVYNLKPDKKFLSKAIFSIITIAVIQSVICIGQAIEGDKLVEVFRPKDVVVGNLQLTYQDIQRETYYSRFTGTLSRSNHLGNYLTFALCFLIAVYFKIGKNSKYLIAIALIIIALFFSSSRISWISAFIGIGAIHFIIRHRFRLFYLILPLLFILMMARGNPFVKTDNLSEHFSILNRFYHIFTVEYIDLVKYTGRGYALLYAMPKVLTTSPIFGLGPGSFIPMTGHIMESEVFDKADDLELERKSLTYVHDVGYAALFIQVGLIGAFVFILMFIHFFKMAKRTLKFIKDPIVQTLSLGSLGFFVAVGIQNLATFNFMYRNESLIIWTVCGFIALFSKTYRKKISGSISEK